MELKREITTFGRQVAYVIGATVALNLLGLIQLPILTKHLGASLYGIWSLINISIWLLFPFALLGLQTGIVRFLASEKDIEVVREDFFSACFIVGAAGIVLSLLLFALSGFLANLIFKDVTVSPYIKLASILILLNATYQLLRNFFRIKRRIGLYVTIDLTFNVAQIGLIVLFLMAGYALTGVIYAVIITGAMVNLITLFIILKEIGFQFPKFSHMKSYLKWSVPLIPNIVTFWVIDVSDRYIVSYFLGAAATGIYNASYYLGSYASFILVPLGTVMFPYVSKSYDEGNQELTRSYLNYSLKYLMLITIPAAVGLSMLAKSLLGILTQPEFISGSIIVPVVALSAVFRCVYQMSVTVLNLAGKNGLAAILLGIAAGLNVLLNFLLIPHIGIVGAALATLVAYAVLGILTLIVSRRYFKFNINTLFIAKSVFASAAMALCIWLINPNSTAVVVTAIFVGIIVYFTALLLIKGLSKEELMFFMSLIRNKI